jgi:hypothetical protein
MAKVKRPPDEMSDTRFPPNIARDRIIKIFPTERNVSEADGVSDPLGCFPPKTNYSADEEVWDSGWGQNEGTRQRHQQDRFGNE